jgi:uncharacterized RDD family membrane protein YckC
MVGKIRFAHLWSRFLALSVDFIIFCIFFFPATRFIRGTWLLNMADHRWNSGLFITDPICISFLMIMFSYFVILEGLFGITVGKWVTGIKVVDENGGVPGLVKAFIRNVLRIVDGLPAFNILGVILILYSEDRKRFGDRCAGTFVVHRNSQ